MFVFGYLVVLVRVLVLRSLGVSLALPLSTSPMRKMWTTEEEEEEQHQQQQQTVHKSRTTA